MSNLYSLRRVGYAAKRLQILRPPEVWMGSIRHGSAGYDVAELIIQTDRTVSVCGCMSVCLSVC